MADLKEKLKFEIGEKAIVKLLFESPREYDGQYGKSYMYTATHKQGDNWNEVVFYASAGLNGILSVIPNATSRDLVIEKHTDGTKQWFSVNGKTSDDIQAGNMPVDEVKQASTPATSMSSPLPQSPGDALTRIEKKIDEIMKVVGAYEQECQSPTVDDSAIPF